MRKLDSIRRVCGGITVGEIVLGVVAATVLAACGGSGSCHNLPLATGLIGQNSYARDLVNAGGAISGSTLAAPVSGFVSDGSGLAYIADTGNNRILGWNHFVVGAPSGDPKGPPSTPADFVIGQASLTANTLGTGDAGCSNFGLSGPTKVSISSDGTKLVVTDTGNNRVLIWNSLPTANTPPNVVIGQADCSTRTSSPITASSLSNPTGAMIGNGTLVVVDQNNNRVLIWNKVPTANNTPADVELGQDNSTGNGFKTNVTGALNPTLQTIEFFLPTDVWTDGARLLVSDSGNNRVLFWNQIPSVSNTTATSVIGQPSGFSTSNPGTSNQTLTGPVGVSSDGTDVFIADAGNNRVLIFKNFPANQQRGATADGVYGQEDFTHHSYNDDDQNGIDGNQDNNQTNVNATQNTLHGPSGTFTDNAGNLYISDRSNNRILIMPVNQFVNGGNTGLCTDYNQIDPLSVN